MGRPLGVASAAAQAGRTGGVWGNAPPAAGAEKRPAGLPEVRLPLPVALSWVLWCNDRTNASPPRAVVGFPLVTASAF